MNWSPEEEVPEPLLEEPCAELTVRLWINGRVYTYLEVAGHMRDIEHLLKQATGKDIEDFVLEAEER